MTVSVTWPVTSQSWNFTVSPAVCRTPAAAPELPMLTVALPLQTHQGSRGRSVTCLTSSLGKGQAWRPQHIYSQSAAEVTRFESGGAVNGQSV